MQAVSGKEQCGRRFATIVEGRRKEFWAQNKTFAIARALEADFVAKTEKEVKGERIQQQTVHVEVREVYPVQRKLMTLHETEVYDVSQDGLSRPSRIIIVKVEE